jgi:hypothetical protein
MENGMSLADVLNKMGVDTEGVNSKIAELTATGLTQEEAFQSLADSGDETSLNMLDVFGSIEAGAAALALTGNNTEAFNGNLERLTDSTKETDDAFEKMTQTTEYQNAVMKEKFNKSLTELGDKMLKIINPAITFFANNMELLAPIIITIVAVIGTLLIILGVYNIVMAVVAMVNAVAFLPVILVILAVILIVGLLVAAWIFFKDTIISIFNSVVEVFAQVFEWIKQNWELLLAGLLFILWHSH